MRLEEIALGMVVDREGELRIESERIRVYRCGVWNV